MPHSSRALPGSDLDFLIGRKIAVATPLANKSYDREFSAFAKIEI
jgi:hypothetical protein